MQNVRKDGTVTNKMDRTQWERETISASEMTDQDISKQNDLLDYWKNVSQKKDLRPSEIAELELQRRISACTEGDTSEARTKTRILEHKADEKLDEWRRNQFKQEDEEQFTQELREQGEKYSDAVKRARKSVGL